MRAVSFFETGSSDDLDLEILLPQLECKYYMQVPPHLGFYTCLKVWGTCLIFSWPAVMETTMSLSATEASWPFSLDTVQPQGSFTTADGTLATAQGTNDKAGDWTVHRPLCETPLGLSSRSIAMRLLELGRQLFFWDLDCVYLSVR